MTRWFYHDTIDGFRKTSDETVLGELTKNSDFAVERTQRDAWLTEFHIQGLELDWTCIAWDADLRYSSSGWTYKSFRGNRWQNIKDLDRQRYLRNAYRVLLTRARQGMVIVVPPGDAGDPTRRPAFYDPTYDYLVSIGLPEL